MIPCCVDNPPPEVVVSPEALRRAWLAVRRAGPSPGADGVTPDRFEAHLGDELRALRHEILTRTYVPRPVRRYSVVKPSGKRRPLTIWAIRDRVAQRAIHDYLTPVFEGQFLDCSYGFRPGLAPRHAIQAVVEARDMGRRWVLDADIADCFTSIPTGLLMVRVRQVVPSKLARWLIGLWLHTPVEGRRREVTGVAQGSVISPQLANLYLHSFDEMVLAALPGHTLVRFADDFVILARRKQHAHWALGVAARSLANLRLRLNREKTRVVHFNDGFRFLGAVFQGNAVLYPGPGEEG